VLSILECKSLENTVEFENNSKLGLSSTVYTPDVNWAFKAIEKLDADLHTSTLNNRGGSETPF
jgi:alpha-ketoglutaric semialdehyde dehydrogenase